MQGRQQLCHAQSSVGVLTPPRTHTRLENARSRLAACRLAALGRRLPLAGILPGPEEAFAAFGELALDLAGAGNAIVVAFALSFVPARRLGREHAQDTGNRRWLCVHHRLHCATPRRWLAQITR